MKRGGPIGGGWKEDELPAGSDWRQWSGAGVIWKEFRDYTLREFMDGKRIYSGEGGGKLIFDGKGGVNVHWNQVAAIASLNGSGNRKHPITTSEGKRTPPKLARQVEFVEGIRGCFIITDEHSPEKKSSIPGLPEDAEDPEAIKLTELFQKECYYLFSSLVRGEAKVFEHIAECLKFSKEIRGKKGAIPEVYSDVVEAVREAAIKADGIPSRPDVEQEYRRLAGENAGKKELREVLGRMGFAWIHGPTGRPRRKVGKTPR